MGRVNRLAARQAGEAELVEALPERVERVLDWTRREEPDVLCFQEIKTTDELLALAHRAACSVAGRENDEVGELPCEEASREAAAAALQVREEDGRPFADAVADLLREHLRR